MATDFTNFITSATFDTPNSSFEVSNSTSSNTLATVIDRTLDFNDVVGIPLRLEGTDVSLVDPSAPSYSIFKNSITGYGYVKSPSGGWVVTYIPDTGDKYVVPLFVVGSTYPLGTVISGLDGIKYASNVTDNTVDPTVKILLPTLSFVSKEFVLRSGKLIVNEQETTLQVYTTTHSVVYNRYIDTLVYEPTTTTATDFTTTPLTNNGHRISVLNGTVTFDKVVGNVPSFSYGNIQQFQGSLYVHNLDDGWVYRMKEGDSYFRKEFDIGTTTDIRYTIIQESRCLFVATNGTSVYDSSDLLNVKYTLPFAVTDIASIDNEMFTITTDGVVQSTVFTEAKWRVLPIVDMFNAPTCLDTFITIPVMDKTTIGVFSLPTSTFTIVDISAVDTSSMFVLYNDVSGNSMVRHISLSGVPSIISEKVFPLKQYSSISIYKGQIFLVRNSTVVDTFSLTISSVSVFDMSSRISGNIVQLETIGATLYVLTSSDLLYSFNEPLAQIYDTAVPLHGIVANSRVYPFHSTYGLISQVIIDSDQAQNISLETGLITGLDNNEISTAQVVCYTPFGILVVDTVTNVVQIHSITQVKRLK